MALQEQLVQIEQDLRSEKSDNARLVTNFLLVSKQVIENEKIIQRRDNQISALKSRFRMLSDKIDDRKNLNSNVRTQIIQLDQEINNLDREINNNVKLNRNMNKEFQKELQISQTLLKKYQSVKTLSQLRSLKRKAKNK